MREWKAVGGIAKESGRMEEGYERWEIEVNQGMRQSQMRGDNALNDSGQRRNLCLPAACVFIAFGVFGL